MKNSEIFKHGGIFAIPLWQNLGFFYAKMIFGSELQGIPCRKKDIFIKVFDYHTQELKKDFDPHFFRNKDLFVDPFILAGMPKLRGKNKWEFLYQEEADERDSYIPHYMQVSYFDSKVILSNEPVWILMYGNINSTQNAFFPYHRVKHLPIHRGKSYDIIGLNLTFEWLRRKSEDPDKYFQYDEGMDIKKEIKYEVFNMTVDYRTVPSNIRGRVAPE